MSTFLLNCAQRKYSIASEQQQKGLCKARCERRMLTLSVYPELKMRLNIGVTCELQTKAATDLLRSIAAFEKNRTDYCILNEIGIANELGTASPAFRAGV